MDLEFDDENLRQLATDANYLGGYSPAVVKSFRKKIQIIKSAIDERDLYAMRSLNFKELKGSRKGDFSIRLNRQWRLIISIVKGENNNTILIVSIEDYH